MLYSSLDLLPVTLLILFSLIMLSRYLTTHDAPLRCLMDPHGCELILSSGRRLLVTPGFGFLSTHLQLLSVQDARRRRHIISAVAGISTAEQQRQLRRLLLALPSLRRQDSV